MRSTMQFLAFLLAVMATLVGAQIARAQVIQPVRTLDTPKVEVFGGYSYLHADAVMTGAPVNLQGASVSMAYNLKDWLGVVADVGLYHRGTGAGNGRSLTVSSYQFGPRITSRGHDHLVPFAQVLLGMGHAGGTLYTAPLAAGTVALGTNNSFVLTAGGGADWKLTHTIGIRIVQAEYLYSQFLNGHGNSQGNLRLSAGIVFRFGQH